MEKVGVNQIKERVVDVIRELRGLTLLTKNDVHIERFIRKKWGIRDYRSVRMWRRSPVQRREW